MTKVNKNFAQKLSGKQYKSTQYLCTKAEQNFLNQLTRKIPLEKYYVSSKVRLADLTMPVNRKNIGLFNKVAKKHVDFVICNRNDSSIVACIELDDSSHNSKSAAKRDSDKNRALTDANIALFRVKASRSYSEKLNQIVNFLDLDVPVRNEIEPVKKPKSNHVDNVSQNDDVCPRCTSKMNTIKMKGFINKGKVFKTCQCGYKTEPK